MSGLRVAMIAACPMPARRGTPLRIERLSEALIARGHHVELMTYPVCDDARELPFPVHRIFKRRVHRRMPAGASLRKLSLYDPALAAKVWHVLGQSRFDVMYAHQLEGLLVALPARLRHGVPIVYDAHTTERVVGRVRRWFDGVLHNSVAGVETAQFQVPVSPRNDGLTRLIYTGSLAPHQAVEMLLEAFAVAYRARPILRLVMAASSPWGSYDALARKLGIREAIQLIPDDFGQLPRQLAEADIAVLPRMQCDGIPQKLLNYMAAGKGIVSSAGSAQVLEHERTGLIVPNGDAKAFAAAIVRLADDRAYAKALGSAARDYVERNYSWDVAAVRLERVFERVVAPPVVVCGARPPC